MVIPTVNFHYRTWWWLLLVVVFGLGWASGRYTHIFLRRDSADSYSVIARLNDPQYSFVSPLLFCKPSENKEFGAFKPLEQQVAGLIKKKQAAGDVTRVSVYYRDLDRGRWFGVDENAQFAPASLFKIPIMIAYFKLAESDPEILDRQLVFRGDNSAPQTGIADSETIYLGQAYRTLDLMRRMIAYSDNRSASLLLANINQKSLLEVITDLGLPPLKLDDTGDVISPKAFSLFFRTLYNATYLNRYFSEQALNLLSQNAFRQGLSAGVPKGVRVAGKFGDRFYQNSDSSRAWELHECGIVYRPYHPYLLCVMTQGAKSETLAETIRDISKLIYDQAN